MVLITNMMMIWQKVIIIKKLEEIGSKMDMIIANQEKAYCVMQKIQKNLLKRWNAI